MIAKKTGNEEFKKRCHLNDIFLTHRKKTNKTVVKVEHFHRNGTIKVIKAGAKNYSAG